MGAGDGIAMTDDDRVVIIVAGGSLYREVRSIISRGYDTPMLWKNERRRNGRRRRRKRRRNENIV